MSISVEPHGGAAQTFAAMCSDDRRANRPRGLAD